MTFAWPARFPRQPPPRSHSADPGAAGSRPGFVPISSSKPSFISDRVFLALVDLRSGKGWNPDRFSSRLGRGPLALGPPAQAWDWDIQKQVDWRCCGRIFPAISPGIIRRRFWFVASLLAKFPIRPRFMLWCRWLRAVSGCDARDRRPSLRPVAGGRFPMVFNHALVGQNGFSHRRMIGRHAVSMPARPVLSGIVWFAELQAAIRTAVSDRADRASQWTVFFTAGAVAARCMVSWLASAPRAGRPSSTGCRCSRRVPDRRQATCGS